MVEQKKYKTFEEFAKDRKIFERKEEMISACLKIEYKIFDYHKDKDEIKKLKYRFEERLNNPHIRKLDSAILYLLYQPGIILTKDCFGNESRLLTTEKQETIDLYDAYLALNGDYYSFDFNIKDFEENNNLNKLGISAVIALKPIPAVYQGSNILDTSAEFNICAKVSLSKCSLFDKLIAEKIIKKRRYAQHNIHLEDDIDEYNEYNPLTKYDLSFRKYGINKPSDIDNLINAALDFSRVYKNKEIFEFRYDAEKILNKGLNKFKKKIKILV